jgi:hypothetical protein
MTVSLVIKVNFANGFPRAFRVKSPEDRVKLDDVEQYTPGVRVKPVSSGWIVAVHGCILASSYAVF